MAGITAGKLVSELAGIVGGKGGGGGEMAQAGGNMPGQHTENAQLLGRAHMKEIINFFLSLVLIENDKVKLLVDSLAVFLLVF